MRDDSRTVPDPTLQFEFRILQVHKGHHAAVHEETDLLVEHDGRSVVRRDHAVGYVRTQRLSGTKGLPEKPVADLVPPDKRVDGHVLYPHQIVAVRHMVEHLGEYESVDLPVLLGNEA